MLIYHTSLLEQMRENPKVVLNGIDNVELKLLESYISDFTDGVAVPPVSQIQEREDLEKYYLFLTYLNRNREIEELAEKTLELPFDRLTDFTRNLFDSVDLEIDTYLMPIGHPYGDALVRPANGKSVIIFNLAAFIRYGANNEERLQVISRILEHEIFHICFDQLYITSPYWAEYRSNLTQLNEAKVLILNEGVAHFIADRRQVERYLSENRSTILQTLGEYHKAIQQLEIGTLSNEEAKGIFFKGVCGSYLEKYFAIAGMLATNIIYNQFGVAGIKHSLSDMEFFIQHGLNELSQATLR